MVARIFTIINKEFGGLHEAAYLLGIFALLSQVLGLIRDRLLAHIFGASLSLDIYYAAFRIPDFLFVSVCSFVGASVLIPFLIEKNNEDSEKAKKFLKAVFTFFFISISFFSVLAFIFMPVLASFVAPGFSPAEESELILLSRILLLSPILLGVSNLFGSITQSFRKFFVFAMSPVLYNAGIILGILFLYPSFGLPGLALGVLLGAIFHLGIQIFPLRGTGFLPKIVFSFPWEEVRRVVFLSLPRTLTLSAQHIVLLVLVSLASLMKDGSIATLQFSFNLQSVPLSIIGVSYSIAAFPTLARLFSAGEHDKFLEQISSAARHVIFWSIPAIFLFIVLRAQIVRVILGSGSFNWEHTRLVAASLALFSVSLLAQNLILLFVRGYYAGGNTKRPLFINLFSSLFTVGAAFFLLHVFKQEGHVRAFFESLLRIENLSGTEIIVLPLAFAMGMSLNALLLWIFFQRDFGGFTQKISRSFFESFAASFLMGVVIYNFLNFFDDIFDLDTFVGVFLQGALSGILGLLAGGFILYLMKNRELSDIAAALGKKFWKKSVLAPGQEEL